MGALPVAGKCQPSKTPQAENHEGECEKDKCGRGAENTVWMARQEEGGGGELGEVR